MTIKIHVQQNFNEKCGLILTEEQELQVSENNVVKDMK